MRAAGGLLYGERMSAETIIARFDVTGWDRAELPGLGLPGADDDWLGARMFFASFDEQTNLQLLERSGFELDEARVVPFDEPVHGLVRFMWVLASTPG